jgi:hypothetical protein
MVCLIKSILRTIKYVFNTGNFIVVSGHDFIEVHNDRIKQVLECSGCKNKSVGYW